VLGTYEQVLEKDDAYPVRHTMSSGPSKVPVNDDDGDQDGEGVHDKGKEEILGNEWEDE